MSQEELLKKIASILQRLEIHYFITGSLALALWGRPRSTHDIDVGIQLLPKNLTNLAAELLKIDKYVYVDEGTMREALEKKGEFNFIHSDSGEKVDFWVLKDDDFAKEQLKRRVKKTLDGQDIYFASAEDLILNKLLWHKDSGSARQLEDIESVFEFTKDLDREYLQKWASIHGTKDTLDELKQKL